MTQAIKVCAWCGHSFEWVASVGRPPKTCSASCRRARQRSAERVSQRARALERRKRDPKVCEACGAVRVDTGSSWYRWCSDECRPSVSTPRDKTCLWCQQMFAIPVGTVGNPPSYCSAECRGEGDARRFHLNRTGTDWRDHNARRRAKIRDGCRSERVESRAIFERDGWRCQLCGARVPRSAKWPDPRSPSLDHIVPLSQGGGHEPRNVQLTHLTCNVRKQARASSDQLRLFG